VTKQVVWAEREETPCCFKGREADMTRRRQQSPRRLPSSEEGEIYWRGGENEAARTVLRIVSHLGQGDPARI